MRKAHVGLISGGVLLVAAVTACTRPEETSPAPETSPVAATPPAAAPTAKEPEPSQWACNETVGQCNDIKVRDRLPGDTNHVQHLAAGAKFLVTFDGKDYGVKLISSGDWLPEFEKASPLAWNPSLHVLDYDDCNDDFAIKARAAKATTAYAHFSSKQMPLHPADCPPGQQCTTLEDHTWYIYPMLNNDGKPAYCLTFSRLDGGGSHDGAVHGDP